MVLLEIISAIFHIVNPLSFVPNFFAHTYPYFFIFTLIFFVFVLIKNKTFLNYLYETIKKTSKFILSILVSIAIFHLINSIYSADPLSNLTHPGSTVIFHADDFYYKHQFTQFGIVSYGYSTLLLITKFLFDFDHLYVMSFFGIFFSILTIFTLFLVVKHLTKNNFIAILGCLFYVLMRDVVLYSTMTTANTISSFFILLLFLLYATHSSKINNLRVILFCSILLVYFRVENFVYLLIFALFLLINKTKKMKTLDFVIAYLFFTPHFSIIIDNEWVFSGGDASGHFSDLTAKLVSFYNEALREYFSELFFLLFLIGVVYMIKKRWWSGLLVFFGLFSVYLYTALIWLMPYGHHRHIFSLIPVTIVFIMLGFYAIYNLFNSKFIKILLLSLFCSLLIFGLDSHFFTKFESNQFNSYHHYSVYYRVNIEPNIIAGNLSYGKKVILYGDPVNNVFKRFYRNYYLVDNNNLRDFRLKNNISSYDYVVYFKREVNETELEKALKVDLAPTNIINRAGSQVHIFKIIDPLKNNNQK